MNSGSYSGVAALRAQERRLEAVAHNLANANTPAYKRATSITEGFRVEGARQLTRTGRAGGPDSQPKTRHQRNYAQGDIKRTDVPSHLALMGSGFFALEGEQGEIYTRDGSFRIDDNGVLQSAEGYPLAWRGTVGRIDSTGTPITFEPDGTLKQNGAALGQLKIVDFEDPQRLEMTDGGFYFAPADLAEVQSEANVHQGALEGSNSSPVDELIELIRIQRSFESVTRMMAQVEQTYQKLVRANT